MCEANVYMLTEGREELILERVDRIVPQGNQIYLENIFGERKTLEAHIREMQLVDHRIILEREEKR